MDTRYSIIRIFESISALFSLDEYDALFKKPKYFPLDFDEYKEFEDTFFCCIESITMQPYDFKALVPTHIWAPPTPTLTKFTLDVMPESK